MKEGIERGLSPIIIDFHHNQLRPTRPSPFKLD